MKTYEQLMTHYWGKIVPMAESAGVNPWECVKGDIGVFGKHPTFRETHPEDYTFAITILEGKPVFVGDKVYFPTGLELIVDPYEMPETLSVCTWTPPAKKRTFMLNGVELPCPVNQETGFNFSIQDSYGCRFTTYFESSEDSRKVFTVISDLLYQARDKE